MRIDEHYIAERLAKVERSVAGDNMREVCALCLSCVDLTTLSPCDTESTTREFAQRAVAFYGDYPGLRNVASLCVYPPFIESVGMVIDGTPLRVTAVAGGFPSSQTFLEVKALEVAMAVESGADEIDIVIAVGEILEGRYDEAQSEVGMIRSELGGDGEEHATLKVILEVGELGSYDNIYAAAMAAMRGGADFIKTSTGKTPLSATPEAVVVMATAIRDFYAQSGRCVGIKVAGGVRTAEDAVLYHDIILSELGEEWLTPELFRIGASSLANELLTVIVGDVVKCY